MNDTHGFAPTEKMLTPTSLAEMLAISDRHLTNLRKEDASFPAPVMLGKLPRWSPATIRRWMDPCAHSCGRSDGHGQDGSESASKVKATPTGKKAKAGKRAERVR